MHRQDRVLNHLTRQAQVVNTSTHYCAGTCLIHRFAGGLLGRAGRHCGVATGRWA